MKLGDFGLEGLQVYYQITVSRGPQRPITRCFGDTVLFPLKQHLTTCMDYLAYAMVAGLFTSTPALYGSILTRNSTFGAFHGISRVGDRNILQPSHWCSPALRGNLYLDGYQGWTLDRLNGRLTVDY